MLGGNSSYLCELTDDFNLYCWDVTIGTPTIQTAISNVKIVRGSYALKFDGTVLDISNPTSTVTLCQNSNYALINSNNVIISYEGEIIFDCS